MTRFNPINFLLTFGIKYIIRKYKNSNNQNQQQNYNYIPQQQMQQQIQYSTMSQQSIMDQQMQFENCYNPNPMIYK